jgi:hypothetical protein
VERDSFSTNMLEDIAIIHSNDIHARYQVVRYNPTICHKITVCCF